ncbi:ATP-NAD kinase-like domain-containing protein [Melampsora americana]|nr:ATP-NAD kinase-like domain-containing protein [Melampsora americana]
MIKELKMYSNTSFLIALGGDGTVLHVTSIFKKLKCPDILGFNLGTIGFLLPFPVNGFEKVLKNVLDGRVKREERMRLSCWMKSDVKFRSDSKLNHLNSNQLNHDGHSINLNSNQLNHDGNSINLNSNQLSHNVPLSAVNEVSLHRSQYPHMTPIHISIDGRFLTTAVADGLVVATPTGSTAYSCSAGGPIVHPAVGALLITPICPRSLSFRPLVLPSDVRVELTLDSDARASAELALDGISTQTLNPGESILIQKSSHPIRLFSPGDGWVDDLNLMLNFNKSFVSKSDSQDWIQDQRE